MSSEQLAYVLAGATLIYFFIALFRFIVSVPKSLRRIADIMEQAVQRRKKER